MESPRPSTSDTWSNSATSRNGEVWLHAEVSINRADLGLTWNLLGLVSMNNTLTVHAVFTKR